MRPIFRGFCINQYGIGPLHYISRRSDFGFEFAEIFVIKNRLADSVSRKVGYKMLKRKLPSSVSRESLTPRLGKSGSRRLGKSGSHRLAESRSRYGE